MERYFFSISVGRSPLEARQVFTSTDPKLAVAAITSIIAEGSDQRAERDGAEDVPRLPKRQGRRAG